MEAEETLLQTRKFDVRAREVPTDGGQPHRHVYVVHPGAVVILPLLTPDRLLLIGNGRPAVEKELLELPAGTLEPPEPAEACAARELAEETGYQAARLEPLLSFYSTPGFCTEKLHAFVATGLTPGEVQHESSEQIRPAPMTWDEALEAIRTGRIEDGKTICTLLYYDRFIRGGGVGQ